MLFENYRTPTKITLRMRQFKYKKLVNTHLSSQSISEINAHQEKEYDVFVLHITASGTSLG